MSRIKNEREHSLHMQEIVSNIKSPNIIFCCTPLVSVDVLEQCWRPFVNMGFNVYAFDFAGTGKSTGDWSDFTPDGILDDFNSVVRYVRKTTKGDIYLFADAGIGGLIGQYYTCGNNEINGFAQFAAGTYQDLSTLGIPTALGKIFLLLLRLLCQVFPKTKIKMNPPKYSGYHAELDYSFYKEQLAANPHFFRTPIQFLRTLLEMFYGKKSRMKYDILVPTLVIKTNHDRYFSKEYFDNYFENLRCPKRLHVVDDVHNSYVLYPDIFVSVVSQWFWEIEHT